MRKFLGLFLCLATLLAFHAIHADTTSKNPKVVLITGASRGIGLATAEHLADKGYCVYATVRHKESFDPIKHKNIHIEELDVTDVKTIRKTVKKILKNHGRIDVLINNAGYALGGPVECLKMKEINAQMDVNFFGVIRVCQEVLPAMRKQKSGQIINISSEQGTYGLPYGSLYTASKAALESLSEALSLELLPWNIAVSIVEPGFVSTDFTIKLGQRKVKNNPYEKVLAIMEQGLVKKDLKIEPDAQDPIAVAGCILQVIEDPKPKLRYQTSAAAKEMVSMKLKDLSGEEYTQKMKRDWQETYFPEQKKP